MAIFALCSAGFAQTTDYSRPANPLNPLSAYTGRDVPEPNLANSGRIDQILKGGKIYLSLNDAIALALENNLDLAIARFNLSIADTELLRTAAGGSTRGVATGLVQGTPGGGGSGLSTSSGSGAGGSSAGSGGAGTGSGGQVTSTLGAGASVDSFDPTVTGSFQLERAVSPQSNTVFTGVSSLNQNSGVANLTYSQGFKTGTGMSVSFNNSRATTNSINSVLNPALNSSFRFTVRQKLLSGFGFQPNTRFIKIARNNREISDVSFRNQVISTVSQIQNIYWDLVNAYEDVKVKERSLALAQKTLNDNRKQVEIGTLAPIEIVRAESEAATRNQELIVSQTNLQLQQLLMKNAITRNMSDPGLAAADVVPTDVMQLAVVEPVVPTEDLINEAIANRPDLTQTRMDLVNRDINKRAARNALLPSLDLFAFYGASALGGDQNALRTCGNPAAPTTGCLPAGTVSPVGYGGAFGNLFDSSAPDKGIGFSLTLPIRNRAAQADQVRSELEYRQAQMRMQQLVNQIRIEVRNAQFTLLQNRARVEAAQKARTLAFQSLDAEQKKYALGASTNFQVLQAQRDLALAESNLVVAMSAYEKSRVELDRVTGQTLRRNGIDIGEAESGAVQRVPAVPGVVPNPDLKPQQ